MIIKVEGLSKQYFNSKKRSLDNVNLNIPKGVFGLIGENGAGKTTLLKSISTIIPVSCGTIKVMDYVLPSEECEVRKRLGYLPQNNSLFENLTVFEMMDYIGLMKQIFDKGEREKEIVDLLRKFNLEEKIHVKIKHLSGGMKQRVGIAQSLLGKPEVIILDEPTVGLDPKERLHFRNIINEIAQDKVVIISTHIISEIATMCDNLAVMKDGKVLYCGSMEELLDKAYGKVYIDIIPKESEIEYSKYGKIISITRRKEKMEVRFIVEEEISKSYKLVEPTLEDAYFYISYW